jgi:hypothetical protein
MKTTTNVIHPKALAEMRRFFRSEFNHMVSVIETYEAYMTEKEKVSLSVCDKMGDFFDIFDVFMDRLNDWEDSPAQQTTEVTA